MEIAASGLSAPLGLGARCGSAPPIGPQSSSRAALTLVLEPVVELLGDSLPEQGQHRVAELAALLAAADDQQASPPSLQRPAVGSGR